MLTWEESLMYFKFGLVLSRVLTLWGECDSEHFLWLLSFWSQELHQQPLMYEWQLMISFLCGRHILIDPGRKYPLNIWGICWCIVFRLNPCQIIKKNRYFHDSYFLLNATKTFIRTLKLFHLILAKTLWAFTFISSQLSLKGVKTEAQKLQENSQSIYCYIFVRGS